MIELFRALGALTDPPAPAHRRLARLLDLGAPPEADRHADLFLFQLPPFGCVYVGPEGKLGGQAADRFAGFWRALGRTPPLEPDHLGTLLGLYAGLLEAAAAESGPGRVMAERAATALLTEHIAPWVPAWADRAGALAAPFYRAWAALLLAALTEVVRRASADGPPPLPLHLRSAPGLPDPVTEGGAAFLDGLLAPVRSGMVLARADLARCAAALGLGLRAGERRYALEAMLGQDAPAVLSWLAAEADAWALRHQALTAATGPAAAAFWIERARSTARRLRALTPDLEAASAWSP